MVTVVTLTVRLARDQPDAATATLAATWLLDVLRGVGCDVATDGEERVVATGPETARAAVEDAVRNALAEPRFTGWRRVGPEPGRRQRTT